MSFNTLVKQVEANIGGGIRISVYKQIFNPDGSLASEEPHRITIGAFDDFDLTIAENSAHLQAMGFPPINADELTFVTAQRDASHAHPITQEIMRVEAEKIHVKRVAEEETRNRIEAETKLVEEARQKTFDAAVSAAVDKVLAKAKP